MHQQLSDPGTFSQHQPMERDDSGIVAPSNIFHQPMPNSFVDFSKVSYRDLDISCFACSPCVCVCASAATAPHPSPEPSFIPELTRKGAQAWRQV